MDINKTLAEEFKLRQEQIDNTVALLDDDKTIPFIARYRKELTGSLDDQVLREIADRLTYLRNLEKRKGEIISSITEQEKMTDEIMSAIENAKTLVEVEDIYRPFKPKRKTRASVAREKGLEPLAELILTQDKKCDPQVEGSKFINEEKGVKSADEALHTRNRGRPDPYAGCHRSIGGRLCAFYFTQYLFGRTRKKRSQTLCV